ncbi:MAG: PKD domain-containing protein [Saprospiraceae bacterium]
MKAPIVFLLVFWINFVLTGQTLPPKQAYAFDILQLHSGHSLTDPLFHPHWPGQFVNLMTYIRGTYADNEIGKSTIPGSSMKWRWEHPTDYPDAKENIEDFELLSITEVANLCYEGGSDQSWYHDCIEEQKSYLSGFANNAWVKGNHGNGAATLLWTNWVNINGENGPFRQMLDTLGGEWERMQDYANDHRISAATPIYMIPGHKMMARLYDDIVDGKVPGISNISQFFSDNIHPNELGAYAIAMIHFACIFNQSPVGLPHNLINDPPSGTPIPSEALALYLQNMIWDVVTSYPRTGIYNKHVIAQATATPTSGVVPLTVHFHGAEVSDSSRQNLVYEWDFGDGEPKFLMKDAIHTYTQPGIYEAKFTVSDGQNNMDDVELTIIVNPTNSVDTCIISAEENFDYSAGQALHGLQLGQGFLLPWEVQNSNDEVPGYSISPNGLTYPGLLSSSGALSGGNKYLACGRRLDNSLQGSFKDNILEGSDVIGSKTDSSDLWMSFLISKMVDNDDEVDLSLHSSDLPYCDLCEDNHRIAIGYFGVESDANGEKMISLKVEDIVIQSQRKFEIGVTYFIVTRLNFASDGTIIEVYINPLPGVLPSSPDISYKTVEPTQIKSLSFYGGATPNSSLLDEIRFAKEYKCVSPTDDIVFIQPPIAKLTADHIQGIAPLLVHFDASQSSDPNGLPLKYYWDFGDGSQIQEGGYTEARLYQEGGGVYLPTLIVENSVGLVGRAQISIQVTNPNGSFPCMTTITSISKSNCNGEGSQIKINIESGVTYSLEGDDGPVDIVDDHHYYDLAPGVYQLKTMGENGCNESFALSIEVDSSTCNGWNSDECSMLLGTNINGIADWEPHRMFRNFLKNTRGEPIPYDENNGQWSFENYKEVLAQMEFDNNGYPLGIPQNTKEGEIRLRYFVSSQGQNMQAGRRYVLHYEGIGQITLHGTISNDVWQPGIISFDLGGDGTFWFQIIDSDPSNHIRNIRILRAEDQGSDLDEQPFYQAFLDKLEPFQVLRAMDLLHTNNSTNAIWEDRRKLGYVTYGGDQGVPLEIIIQLANITNKDIWVCVPHDANDAYVRNMAEMFKEYLNPNITIFLEYSNEVWNWIFQQSQYNIDNNPLGLMYGRAYAQKARKIFRIWHDTYGNEACRVKRVLGVQGGFNYLNEHIIAHLGQDEWDYGSPTHYFGLDHEETGNPRLDILGSSASVDDIMLNAQNNFNAFLPSIMTDYRNIQLLGKEVITYEGGQHFVGNVFGIPYAYQQAMWDAQNSDKMYKMYDLVLDTIRKMGCKLATNFSLVGPQENIYGSWGIMDDIDALGPFHDIAPKYQVHIDNVPSDVCIAKIRNSWHNCFINVTNELPILQKPENYLLAYPNPGDLNISVVTHDENATLIFRDLMGREVLKTKERSIDVSNLRSGIYLITSNGKSIKWIKM